MRTTESPSPAPTSHPAAPPRPSGRPELLSVDFDERPFTVAWELTRSCALACLHCRAEAQPKRHPAELTTAEARGVIDQLVDLAPPVLVLTGGDPLMRPDLFEIAEYAAARGLAVSVSPTATALVTKQRLARLRDAGVRMIHVSLDGAEPATHDAFRGFPGTYERTLRTLEMLHNLEMPAQVGTTVTRHNVHELPAMLDVLTRFSVRMWSLFFLVPTGRGRAEDMVDVETAERTWRWMVDLEGTVPFAIRTTAAPQYRRTMLLAARERSDAAGEKDVRLTGAGYQLRESPAGVQTRGVNDGKGFLFIDHIGNLCPSGFLQLSAGHVRSSRIADVYRHSPLFRDLRDPSRLEGRCGVCRFADLCGGSRARAYGVTGSYLADDPLCGLTDEEVCRPS